MTRREFPRTTFDTINLTPLIDTLFFLLIIFMVTAPLLEYTIEVEPPSMNTGNPIPSDTPEIRKMINVKADGQILFNRVAMSMDELLRELDALRSNPEIVVYLRADRAIEYGRVIDILDQIRKSGFENINLVTSEGD